MGAILDGIVALDFTRLLPGPLCARYLADLGADVIKIEEPGTSAESDNPSVHTARAITDRGKRSIAIDLKHRAGRALAKKLAQKADVVLESFRPGVMTRLGLGWEVLAKVNPRLLYVTLSGYGNDGPYAARPAHDANLAALSGLLSLSGGRPELEPQLAGLQVPALAGGSLHAAMAIGFALFERERSGKGQRLEIAMLDGTLALLAPAFSVMHASGRMPSRGTELYNGARPGYGVFLCLDGRYVAIAALEPKFWARLCELIGRPELVEQRVPADRDAAEHVRRVLAATFARRTRDEWFAELGDAGVCLTPVLELNEVPGDPHIQARDLFYVAPGAKGVVPQVAFPVRFGRTPVPRDALAAPHPGQHTDAILGELGYDAKARARLHAQGVV